MLRYRLQDKLSDREFRLLWLCVCTTRDYDTARTIFDPIRNWIRQEAGIVRSVAPEFVSVSGIGACWQCDLFRGGRFGTLGDYGSIFTNCRRRKRIVRVIEENRLSAMGAAERVIISDSDNVSAAIN